MPSTKAWVSHYARQLGFWSDDPVSRDQITAPWLGEITEAGSCELSIELDGSARGLVETTIRELDQLLTRRRTIHAVENLHEAVVKPWTPDSAERIGELIEAVDSAHRQRPTREKTPGMFGPMAQQDLARLEKQAAGEIVERRIRTGFPQVDAVTGGFGDSDLIIIAGRPSMGKTALAVDFSLSAAKEGRYVLYCTFEMSSREILRRLLSKLSRINVLALRHGDLKPFQLDIIKETLPAVTDLPIFIEQENMNPRGVEQKIKKLNRLIAPSKIGLVVIDHLQIAGVRDTTKFERRDRQIASYTAELKDMAKQLSLVVLCLSQLNRQTESRPIDQRSPRLGDLRESGAIEQDADAVLALYRKFPDTQNAADQSHAELSILKNRSGPTGKIGLTWVPALATFKPLKDHEGGD